MFCVDVLSGYKDRFAHASPQAPLRFSELIAMGGFGIYDDIELSGSDALPIGITATFPPMRGYYEAGGFIDGVHGGMGGGAAAGARRFLGGPDAA